MFQLDTSGIHRSLSHVQDLHPTDPTISSLISVAGSAQEVINNSITSFTGYLGSHDFYLVHVLNICRGYYAPTDTNHSGSSTESISKSHTVCSRPTFTFNFNLRRTLEEELGAKGNHLMHGTTQSWPTEVNGGMSALELVPRILSVVYCVTIVLVTIALAFAVLAVLFSGRFSACFNMISSLTAAIAAGVASILATAIGKNAAGLINEEGARINISAQEGKKFLNLTWAATTCMLAASLTWLIGCIYGRRRSILQ